MSKFLKKMYLSLIILFLYAPIIVLVVFSFNESKNRTNWTQFSLKWYGELFRDTDILQALKYTIVIALVAAILSTIIGVLAAISMYKMNKLTFNIVNNITYLPVLNPDIVTGIALMLLFVFIRFNMGFFSMLMAHITFCIPYVILSVLPKLRQTDKNIYEAAIDLGASPLRALWSVVIPEIKPGIVTGFLLAFTLSVDDFVISYFTSGSEVQNLSMVIYSMARKGINPTINALSTLLFGTVMILLLVINKKNKGSLI